MRHRFFFLASVFVTAIALIACNGIDKVAKSDPQKTQPEPPTTYADGARRITIAELEALIKNNQAYVVDVRNQAMFDDGHIPGSRLIPEGEILNHTGELPRDKTIVTYCS